MHRLLKRAAVVAALGTVVSAAQAANVTLTGWAFGAGHNVATSLWSGRAGAFVGRLTGAGAFDADPFITYCVEIEESFSFGAGAMTGYSIVEGNTYFGAAKAERLGRLLTYVNQHPALVDNAVESTAMQLAIWNVIYDSDSTLALGGAFSDTSPFASHAGLLLVGAAGVSSSAFEIRALKRNGKQDFLLATPKVPEPASLLLAGLALAGLAYGRLRRPRRMPSSDGSAEPGPWREA